MDTGARQDFELLFAHERAEKAALPVRIRELRPRCPEPARAVPLRRKAV